MEAVKKLNIDEEDESGVTLTAMEELEFMAAELREANFRFFKQGQKFIKMHRKGNKPPKEDVESHVESRAIINQMEKAYNTLYKMVYPKGQKTSTNTDSGSVLTSVKSEKSSVGDIVTTIPQKEGE